MRGIVIAQQAISLRLVYGIIPDIRIIAAIYNVEGNIIKSQCFKYTLVIDFSCEIFVFVFKIINNFYCTFTDTSPGFTSCFISSLFIFCV